EVERRPEGIHVRIDGRDAAIESSGRGALRTVTIDGRAHEAAVWTAAGADASPRGVRAFDVAVGARIVPVRLIDPLRYGNGHVDEAAAEGTIEVRAVMPGKVTAILVAAGDEVGAGAGLLVIEAMKMENEITAPRAGKVASILKAPGEPVEAGALLAVLESL
ncbi:MAG TPA: biotin/lipoyl-containing protein, partial [Candidatus Polarisedimenticolia bacterium]|nr:biotin/lipoyl-containing protein [Candidatus Polarisedimenticolia bacterium]